MRKLVGLMAILMSVFILAACGGNGKGDDLTEKYVPKAEEVVQLLNDGSYEEVHGQFDEQMKVGLPVDQMAQLTPVIEQSGEFEEFDKAAVEEQDGYYVVVLTANYSNEDRVYTITYNDKEEIAGLYIR